MPKKTTQPADPPPPYEPSDYERGALAVLELLTTAVEAVTDAEHQIRGLTIHASHEMRALIAGVNASANIAAHVRTEVEKMTTRHLNERHATSVKPRR